MITFRVGDRVAEDIRGVITALGPEAFTTATRSTVPLIDYWRDPLHRLPSLGASLGLSLDPPVDLTFEYPVPVAQGRGKHSFTDLMITTRTAAVAIEAKYTEPRYETVGQWLGMSPSQNRESVLTGWLAHSATGTASPPLSASTVADLPYQLVHRTASVCSVPRPARAVVYQVFGEAVPPYYLDDLRRLRELLPQAARLTFAVLACRAERLANMAALADLRKATSETGQRVHDALLDGPLFAFGDPVVQTATT